MAIVEQPIRNKIFEIYTIWKSLPPLVRREGVKAIDRLGFEDEDLTHKLLLIQTQKDFAKEFKVAENTLTSWNEKLEADDSLYEARKKWVKKLMSNILAAVTKAALEEGDVSRVKFLAQYTGEYVEKSEIINPEITKQTELLRQIAEKK